MKKTTIITIEELMNKKATVLKTLATQLKKEISDTTAISSLTTKKKLADYIIANAPSDKYWFLHEGQEILDTNNRVATTGTSVPKERVEASYQEKCSKLSDFEVTRAKNEIIKSCELNETTPDLSWENIFFMHKELQHTVQHQKRETTKQIKVCGYNVVADCASGYFTVDLSKTLDVADITGDTDVKDFLFEVAVPYADLMETCDRLNVNLITFDPEELPIPEGMDLKQALTHTYKYGMVDISTDDKYFPIGLSASKARSGGVIWLARVANWNAMELLRAEVLHLTTEEYENMKKENCVIAKFETGTIGMRTSSVINVSKAGKKLRGDNGVLNNIKCKVVDDIVAMRNLTTLEPDKTVEGDIKPFKFSLTEREYEVNYSDGSSIIKMQPYMDILHQAGEITDNQYNMFTSKWLASGYDIKVLKEDKDLYRFLTSKDFKSVMQVRFFGGVKGMVIPVAQMDSDARLADVDMLVFKKSAKYISQDAPFEIINFGKFKSTIVKDENDNITNVLESAKLNYQFVQSSGATGETLIKGALKPFADVKDALLSTPNALKAIAGMRGLDDEGDDLLTVLARDLEIEPRLLTEHYHQSKLMDKLEKFVKEIGYGRIPVKGGFRFIISDPVWLYHMAMGDAFESQLNKTQVYYNGVNGRKAGMFRSPMIHYSEPQEVECADVDYLWMYQGIIVLNVQDAIAPAMSGADFDGDKCLIIINWEDDSFESLFVQSLQMPGYIIYDEGNSAPKVDNNIENRIKYYVDLSTPNRTGQITNWATCINDLMVNAEVNNDTKAFNWYKSVLVRLRFAQGWEIDLPKTGISADGPEGDMLPVKYCRPATKPQWFVDKCSFDGRPTSTVNAKGEPIVYTGNSPMEQLHQYAEAFWNQISSGEVVKPNTMLEVIGVTLTEEERNTFEIIKNEVIELERLYRNETRNIMNLKMSGVLSQEEQELMFEKLIETHRDSLNSKISETITSDVIAYACYYASNFRKDNDGNNGKVTGKRSYGWVCYYEETLGLLYRNNNGMSLVALPDREMDSVEIINGDLLIDGKFIRTVEFPDGSYSVMNISGKPFIVVPKELPVITAEEKRQYEIAYAEKKFTFECNAFTVYNQMLNSEDFVKAIEDNNNRFDVLLLSNGAVGICMNGLLYASIKECPTEIIGKRVVLEAHGALVFVPKAKRATTLMKDETHAYSKMLTFTVLIKTDETADMNVVITTTANVESNNDVAFYQESADCDYEALATQFGWND